MGKKRLTVEVLLAAAALPSPPPLAALLPDLTFTDLLASAEAHLHHLLTLLPQADLYLQDEMHITLHPTLTRVWCRRGRRGQRLVQAPGQNAKKVGFGLVDWRDGWLDFALADKRAAEPFCAQVRRAIARSTARGRIAVIVLDNLNLGQGGIRRTGGWDGMEIPPWFSFRHPHAPPLQTAAHPLRGRGGAPRPGLYASV